MKATYLGDAKFFYRNFPNSTVIKVEADGGSFTFNHEMTIEEAVSLRDELTELIQWITNEEVQ